MSQTPVPPGRCQQCWREDETLDIHYDDDEAVLSLKADEEPPATCPGCGFPRVIVQKVDLEDLARQRQATRTDEPSAPG